MNVNRTVRQLRIIIWQSRRRIKRYLDSRTPHQRLCIVLVLCGVLALWSITRLTGCYPHGSQDPAIRHIQPLTP